ncbi:MAG: SRPBCC domain-containing protein [Rhodobacteraceae bacterium]|nr:SRPBCC domain-containing protein [Paracoccaceae bacterium]
MLPPVIKTITVPCPPERAFEIFTRDIDLWWPKDKNSVSAMDGKAAQKVSLIAEKGGWVEEIDHAGNSQHWGSVTEFTPPNKLGLAWHIGRPESEATFVDVIFEAAGAGTKVTLKHYGWEAFGEDAEKMRAGYNAGWVGVFETAFATACEA